MMGASVAEDTSSFASPEEGVPEYESDGGVRGKTKRNLGVKKRRGERGGGGGQTKSGTGEYGGRVKPDEETVSVGGGCGCVREHKIS